MKPVLDKGFVRLIDSMGTDLTVVNAARVSFNKESKWNNTIGTITGVDHEKKIIKMKMVATPPTLFDRDAKLIRYLARHQHWTPFGHCYATLHIKLPIFVARQLMRSNIGIVYNEISRRYVDEPPEFYQPEKWRSRPEGGLKQGSGEILVDDSIPPLADDAPLWSIEVYNTLLAKGVAPEQARIVLPLSTYTEVWMSASLAALARVYSLRIDPHAQWEIQQYASAIGDICRDLWPISWAALTEAPPTPPPQAPLP